MKSTLKIIVLLVVSLTLAACGGAADPDAPVDRGEVTPPASETPEPPAGVRAEAYVDEAQLQIMESFPIQVAVAVQGNLPTPCHSFASEFEIDEEQGRIDVQVYSLAPEDEDLACAQVLQPFEENIRLGSFEQGEFDVYVNGEKIGSFEA